ncbi:hypothetical protein O3P69_020074 [Scylla paramamosain]|uniref:Ig-like domain-containing protein n=1 Tax=Scylla paramamosain TaxID=85552 RepID=A0AAW0TJM6_SCYPA
MGGCGCGGAASPLTCTVLWLLVFVCVARVGGRDVGSKALVAARLRHERGFSRHHQQHYQQFIGSISGNSDSGSTTNNAAETAEDSQDPKILTPRSTHVSTRVGQAATFNCVVRHLGNRQVSWIRGRDLHVLSSGQVTFSSDARLSVSHSEDSWTLTIKFSQPRDAGTYSCQVNTQPPQAVWYNLTVIEARANILGKEIIYLQSGSTVSLVCVIKEQLVIPGLVLWYQDDRLVERQSSRVKVSTTVTNVTTSTLTVEAARLQDSGNYSCWPSAGRPDSVLVHVIQGDPPAAMQHGSSAPGACPLLLVPMALTSLMFLLT